MVTPSHVRMSIVTKSSLRSFSILPAMFRSEFLEHITSLSRMRMYLPLASAISSSKLPALSSALKLGIFSYSGIRRSFLAMTSNLGKLWLYRACTAIERSVPLSLGQRITETIGSSAISSAVIKPLSNSRSGFLSASAFHCFSVRRSLYSFIFSMRRSMVPASAFQMRL